MAALRSEKCGGTLDTDQDSGPAPVHEAVEMSQTNVLTTEAALCLELAEIEHRRGSSEPGHGDAMERAAALGLSALCLSGGGIRSAAFCLGVVQALAKTTLLNEFDYVSSVSGGSYINGWLQVLLHDRCPRAGADMRPHQKSVACVLQELGSGTLPALRRLRGFTSFLTPQPGPASADTWAGITLYLRNLILNWLVFLPVVLLVALLPLFYRTTVRWFVDQAPHESLIPALAVLLAGAACLVFATWRGCVLLPSHRSPPDFATTDAIGWGVAFPVALWAYTIPFVVDFVYYSSHQASITLSEFETYTPGNAYNLWIDALKLPIPLLYVGSLVAGYGLAWITTPRVRHGRSLYGANFVRWTTAATCSGLLMWLGLVLASTDNPLYRLAMTTWGGVPKPSGGIPVLVDSETALTIFAPLVLIGMHLLQTTFYIALRRQGRFAELDREWLGRLNGLVLRLALGLAVISFCALVLPRWLGLIGEEAVWQHRNLSGTAGTAAALAAIAAWIGKFFKAQIEEVANHRDSWREWIASPLVLNTLCLASAVLLFAFAGGIIQHVLGFLQDSISTMGDTGEPLGPSFGATDTLRQLVAQHSSLDCMRVLADPHSFLPSAPQPCHAPGMLQRLADHLRGARSLGVLQASPHNFALPLALQVVTCLLLSLLVAFFGRVNVNRFSMHAVYRNRLVRAFLGTARKRRARNPDPFTGFDLTDDDKNAPADSPEHDDNPGLASLAHAPEAQRLFPVINTTLNISISNNTAWTERKAASFVATPMHCGSGALRQPGAANKHEPAGAFVPTCAYAGKDDANDKVGKHKGVTLGTMMTISGAAISPNWGYHSSPATAFVMTLFNVRLGAWLPNPAVATTKQMRLAGPANSLFALLRELMGNTSVSAESIYLSDGGHFDNLGMYEMLRRRCRYLIIVDAGQDGDCNFFDFGNAIRKAAIDFNIRVTMETMHIYSRKDIEAHKPGTDQAVGFAFGTIEYPPETKRLPDGRRKRIDIPNGKFIYLKPSWLPDVPADVRAFGLANPSFPHVSTVDQWFTESEFESYRALGEWQMQRLTGHLSRQPALHDLFFSAAPSRDAVICPIATAEQTAQ